MESVYRFILEETKRGTINRTVASQLLSMMKEQQIRNFQDIAVIGLALRVPDADNQTEFWNNLVSGKNCVKSLPLSRRQDLDDILGSMSGQPAAIQYSRGSYLERIDRFDYNFFNLSPREASLMDPNQRLFLQTVWEAIEDAGYGGHSLKGTRTGIYAGFGSDSEYSRLIAELCPEYTAMSIPGNLKSLLAGRIAYLLDLHGPSILVDTACSSSLVAIHMACMALMQGECSMAIAGGIKLNMLPVEPPEKLGIESADQLTKTFDQSSDGTAGGEGVGAVLLKPLVQAEKDGDHIYAVIKGSAVNNDGDSMGVTAPNPLAQEEVIVRAWKAAGINPESLSFIEAHGTGTKLGDPIEVEGITKAFRQFTEKQQFCSIGSVKSNYGHLDNAAGMIGFMKAVFSLKNRQLPSSLHFRYPNRNIGFHKSPVYVNDVLRDLEESEEPVRCGVSSFSLGGTNCHMVLEEYTRKWPGAAATGDSLFTLSAKTERSLYQLVQSYIKYFNDPCSLAEVCYTSNIGRGHYQYRLAIITNDQLDLQNKLMLFQSGKKNCPELQIYYGSVNKAAADAAGALLEAYEDVLAEGHDPKRLGRLAISYVQGHEVNWSAMYKNTVFRRVPLPPYVFDEKRCWVAKETEDRGEEQYYQLNWVEAEKAVPPGRTWEGAVLVIVGDGCLSDAIMKELRGQRYVVTAQLGREYSKISAMEYLIRNTAADFSALLAQMKDMNLTAIVHLASLSEQGGMDSENDLTAGLQRGVCSFRNLHLALAEETFADLDLYLIAERVNAIHRSDPVINPVFAPMFALAKVMKYENFNTQCKCIDIDSETEAEVIANEIASAAMDSNVAYRKGIRYVERLETFQPLDMELKPTGIRPKGVYVITGGTGGLGLQVAHYLSVQNQVTLILINRSCFPDKKEWAAIAADPANALSDKVKSLQQVEGRGSQVRCYQADVSCPEDMISVLDEVRETYGSIHGVIHSAGIGTGARGVSIQEQEEEDFLRTLAPKVQGTWLLDRLTQQDKLDFMVLFTSPVTLIGGVGLSGYTCSNSFLDSFVHYRNTGGKRTIAMSWAPWEFTVQLMGERFNPQKQLFQVISSERVREAFHDILNHDVQESIIGGLNYQGELLPYYKEFSFRLSDSIIERIKGGLEQASSYQRVVEVRYKGEKVPPHGHSESLGQIIGGVLGMEKLDLESNFFELGGDSIIAMKVIVQINQVFQTALKVTDLLRFPDLHAFTGFIAEQTMVEDSSQNTARDISRDILLAPEQNYYPVTPIQRGIFIIEELGNAGCSYNMTNVVRITGNFDLNRLEKAFGALIRRHEALRTAFRIADGEVVQTVQSDVPGIVTVKQVETEEEIRHYLKAFIRPFHLLSAPLARLEVLAAGTEQFILCFDIHHIVSDAVSLSILTKELSSLYNGERLEPVRIHFKDYAYVRGKQCEHNEMAADLEYWDAKLNRPAISFELQTDFPRGPIREFAGDTVTLDVSGDVNRGLFRLAHQSGGTLFMSLFAAFHILLMRVSGYEDVIVGTPIALRDQPALEGLVGNLVNVVPVRTRPVPEDTFNGFFARFRSEVLQSFEHKELYYDEMVSLWNAPRHVSRNPIFDVVFAMQNIPIPQASFGRLQANPYRYENSNSKYDLTLNIQDYDGVLSCNMDYNTKLYQKETAEELLRQYTTILEAVAGNGDIQLARINLDDPSKISRKVDLESVEFDW